MTDQDLRVDPEEPVPWCMAMAEEMPPDVRMVAAMASRLSGVGLVEIERCLRLTLDVPAPRSIGRFRQLGELAELLEREGEGEVDASAWPGVPMVSRSRYEEVRTSAAPTAGWLVERVGAGRWEGVCRIAYGLRSDGHYVGIGFPWDRKLPHGWAGIKWKDTQCLAAVADCARELGYVPSEPGYGRWRAARRDRGHAQPLPAPRTVHEQIGSWPEVRRRLNVSDEELERIRLKRVPRAQPPRTVLDALDALDDVQLKDLGYNRTRLRQLQGRPGRLRLPVDEATALAQTLRGSLKWLAGVDPDPGETPARSPQLDGERVRTLRAQRKMTEQQLANAAGGIGIPHLRKLLRGTASPTLGELLGLEEALGAELATGPGERSE